MARDLPKRTAKDERDYIANLQREEPIKSEVIVELREENKLLWQNQERLLAALITAEDALRVYRLQLLEQSKGFAASQSHCVPGCRKHEWHDADGWHRTARLTREDTPQ